MDDAKPSAELPGSDEIMEPAPKKRKLGDLDVEVSQPSSILPHGPPRARYKHLWRTAVSSSNGSCVSLHPISTPRVVKTTLAEHEDALNAKLASLLHHVHDVTAETTRFRAETERRRVEREHEVERVAAGLREELAQAHRDLVLSREENGRLECCVGRITREHEMATGELAKARNELAGARAELAMTQDELSTTRGELEKAREGFDVVVRDMERKEELLCEEKARCKELEVRQKTATAELVKARDQLSSTLAKAQDELVTTRGKLEKARESFDVIVRDMERKEELLCEEKARCKELKARHETATVELGKARDELSSLLMDKQEASRRHVQDELSSIRDHRDVLLGTISRRIRQERDEAAELQMHLDEHELPDFGTVDSNPTSRLVTTSTDSSDFGDPPTDWPSFRGHLLADRPYTVQKTLESVEANRMSLIMKLKDAYREACTQLHRLQTGVVAQRTKADATLARIRAERDAARIALKAREVERDEARTALAAERTTLRAQIDKTRKRMQEKIDAQTAERDELRRTKKAATKELRRSLVRIQAALIRLHHGVNILTGILDAKLHDLKWPRIKREEDTDSLIDEHDFWDFAGAYKRLVDKYGKVVETVENKERFYSHAGCPLCS